MRAILDSDCPSISPNSTGADHIELPPLLTLAYMHSSPCVECQTPDKIALLLARGADVNARDTLGNTCLHAVMDYDPLPDCVGKSRLERKDDLRDILMLMITAGADVYAINDNGETVSAIAHLRGHFKMWSEVLEACGYDVYKVYAGEEISIGWSSAVDSARTGLRAERLSFKQYLEQRKAFSRVEEVWDCEDAEEEQVREMRLQSLDWDDSDDDESGEGQEHESLCGWDDGNVVDCDGYDAEGTRDEENCESAWTWNEDGETDDDEEGIFDAVDEEVKWD